MSRRAAIAATAVLLGVCATSANANPVRLTVAFDHAARLGQPTALRAAVTIDTRQAPTPVTRVQLLYPGSLAIASSGLGLASCTRPSTDFQRVLIATGPGLAGCSPNAVMGYGTAHAEVRLADGEVIPEFGALTVLAGPIADGQLGLVVYVDGQHPFGAKLAYAGAVTTAPAPFGGALAVSLPAIPSLAGFAIVALDRLRITIGSPQIVYYAHPRTRTGRYHPGGIPLPSRCPKHHFRFRVQITFQDGHRTTDTTTVRCPPAKPALSAADR